MNYLVKDLMVSIFEYATIPAGSILFETILTLEEAQLDFNFVYGAILKRSGLMAQSLLF